MQDTVKTLEIYEEALNPAMVRLGLTDLVEDNASPHNNQRIGESHISHNVKIVGYSATDSDKDEIRALIQQQTVYYKRAQDRESQITK